MKLTKNSEVLSDEAINRAGKLFQELLSLVKIDLAMELAT